jgi:hypothetical protein
VQRDKVNRFGLAPTGGCDGTGQYYDEKIPQSGGVTSQQDIERVVRQEKLAEKGKLKVKMVLTGEGTDLNHVVEGEIDLADAHEL